MPLRILTFCIAFACWVSGMKAQHNDREIAALIELSDWFALERQLPSLRRNASPALGRLAGTLTDIFFNRDESALAGIDTLLRLHRQETGFATTASLVYFRSEILGRRGEYGRGADLLAEFLADVQPYVSEKDLPAHTQLHRRLDLLREIPPPRLVRPETDTEIPLRIEPIRYRGEIKGYLPYVTVGIGGGQHSFILDTGCAAGAFVSERFAREAGIRIVGDSILASGIGNQIAKIGTTDSLTVGDIVYRNPVFIVMPSGATADTILHIDAILGLDFLRATGEVRLYPRAGRIVFPRNRTSAPRKGSNLMIENGQPYIEALSERGNERLLFHFDTGNARADLHVHYYEKHKAQIEAAGRKDTVSHGGYGGTIEDMPVYTLPVFRLKVGKTVCEIENIDVNTQPVLSMQLPDEDGALGMDFIRPLDEITIDFDRMSVRVRK